uniref:Uncharacterized protein MANES_10G132000 n=1 Tax=Rhizophora mucronata TaxID=61149 RepID=A0A2P2J1A9_RHIMU
MQWKKEMESAVPPGYDAALDAKPKTKSAKRNERKKEKRLQAALEKGKNLEAGTDGEMKAEETLSTEDTGHTFETVKSLTSQMNKLDVTAIPLEDTPSADSIDSTDLDIDKKIRALKKKIRLAEEKQQKTVPLDLKPEQMDRSTKLENWRQELKCLEDKKAERPAS